MTPIRATYRLQFNREFPFAAAERIVPYLDALGISHVYASPITTARTGSTHGYDVTDPTRINPELGGEAGFRRLAEALRARGMGIIIDIVPNHMGVAGGENAYWTDVLRHGPDSQYARWFDIDWDGPIVLPILGGSLGEAIAAGDVAVVSADGLPALQLYGEQLLPLRPDALPARDALDAAALRALIDGQHYRLASWRTANDSLNWRRFFTVSDLAGVRMEDSAVFEATHALFFDLFAQGLIDGVRVDHVDGLADPAAYCRALRARFDAIGGGRRCYIVVEKILAAGEAMPADWGTDGTSGYDFMREVSGLLHAPAGEAPLAALWEETSGRSADFAREALLARQQLLDWSFAGQLERCVVAFTALARSASGSHPAFEAATPEMLRRAIERLLWVFPVYRSYGLGNGVVLDRALADSAAFCPPGEGGIARHIVEWLAGRGPGEAALAADAVRRFQQLSAPIAAKAVEDTAFYRHGVLLSTNDVGFAPEQFALDVGQFHAAMETRAASFPQAMLTTATHDHKRGEDMRARLAVLSAVPELWTARVARWTKLAEAASNGIDPGDRYMLFQTLFGAWPAAHDRADFPERIKAWQQKALRETKLRSSWEDPDAAYEVRCAALVDALLGSTMFSADLEAFVADVAGAATANSLVQTVLRLTVPGVPDCYQGTELADLSLVDPDNRRPVGFDARAAMLADGGDALSKLHLIARLLAARRASPALFAHGDYRPVAVTGARGSHVVAFTRSHGQERLDCAVIVKAARPMIERGLALPGFDWWQDTAIDLPERRIAARLFADAPYYFRVGRC